MLDNDVLLLLLPGSMYPDDAPGSKVGHISHGSLGSLMSLGSVTAHPK